jgi:hypothetical protein
MNGMSHDGAALVIVGKIREGADRRDVINDLVHSGRMREILPDPQVRELISRLDAEKLSQAQLTSLGEGHRSPNFITVEVLPEQVDEFVIYLTGLADPVGLEVHEVFL